MTTSQREPAEPVGDEDRWLEEEPDEEPAPRPRRRLPAPVPLALSAVLIGAAGFIAGVEVQKRQGSSGTARPGGVPAAVGAAPAGAAGAAGAGAGAGAAATGEVSSVKGNVLYVTDDDGTTVKVTVPSGATVTRSADADARDVHPGDTVVVQGATRANGSVRASSVSATAPGVDLGSLLGGFVPGRSSGGGSGSAGQSAGDDVGSLFGG